MPTKKNPEERYRKYHERLTRWKGQYVSKEGLRKMCPNIQRRQFFIDLKNMKNKLDAPIDYCDTHKGYYYTEPYDLPAKLGIRQKELLELKVAVKMLKQYQHIGLFENLERLQQKIENAVQFEVDETAKNHIYFEEVPYYKGLEHLPFFINAIEYEKEITFTYHSYKELAPVNHYVHPYAIKEHTNRWYIICYNPKHNNFTTFAIDDRLEGKTLQLTGNYFDRKKHIFDIAQHFEYAFGMTAHKKKPIEEVQLQFQPLQFKYFQSKPFHKYKKIKENSDGTVKVKMKLIPNYELTRKIASMGKGVKVLHPQSLIKAVKKYLQDALRQY